MCATTANPHPPAFAARRRRRLLAALTCSAVAAVALSAAPAGAAPTVGGICRPTMDSGCSGQQPGPAQQTAGQPSAPAPYGSDYPICHSRGPHGEVPSRVDLCNQAIDGARSYCADQGASFVQVTIFWSSMGYWTGLSPTYQEPVFTCIQ